MKLSKYGNSVATVAQVSTAIACSICFIFLMKDVWKKYEMGSVTTVISKRDTFIQMKKLPCVSFCPFKAFKSKGFPFTDGNSV